MKEFRPRLPESEDWKELIDFGRATGPAEVLKGYLRSRNGAKEKTERTTEGNDYVISSESERITTLEDLLEHSDVDLDQYEVKRYITNKWDQHSVDKGLVELYQVKAWLRKKYLDTPDPTYYTKWLDAIGKLVEPVEFDVQENTSDSIVLMLADLHIGGFVNENQLVPDYNIEEVKARLEYIAGVVNGYDKPVHVKFLGDFIESFTGKNHKNTWLQIQKHGADVVLEASDIIATFLRSLNNPVSVDIVGGNHDRITSANDDDTRGHVAKLIHGVLERLTSGIPLRFHHRVLTSVHDDVCYIITHGDKRISKMEPSKMVLEYGKQDLFNIMCNAHGHEEKIHDSSVRFQSIQIPAVTVPNDYAQDIGKSSPSGFVIFEPSARAGVNRKTYSL